MPGRRGGSSPFIEALERQVRICTPIINDCNRIGNFFHKCPACKPPEPYTCPLCDWSTPDKWRMKLHVDLRPKWCTDRAEKKARVWGSKV